MDVAPASSDDPYLLTYAFPDAYAVHVDPEHADPFVVALLFLAMRLGEDIRAAGTLAPALAHGLRTYQAAFATWFSHLQPVSIHCDGYADRAATSGAGAAPEGGTGCFFSGGVDSFYTLHAHRPCREVIPHHAVTHGIYIEGLDTLRGDTGPYQQSLLAYRQLFQTLGLDLIPVRTNLKRFIHDGSTGWRPAHGAFLISIALLLEGVLRRCYVPAGFQFGEIGKYPQGSNPLTDPLLSTESLRILHDGADVSRQDKLNALVEWPATYDHLYVCFVRERDGLTNCCRCEKCLRTMIGLKLTGGLDHYTTFPQPLHRRDVRGWRMPHYYATGAFAREMQEYAQATSQRQMASDLNWVLWKHNLRFSRLGRWCRRHLVQRAKKWAWVRQLHAILKGRFAMHT